jgi:hypothetical protein
MTRRRLVIDVYVEEHTIHGVMRQFGLFQEVSVPAAPRLPPTAPEGVEHKDSKGVVLG